MYSFHDETRGYNLREIQFRDIQNYIQVIL